MEIDTTFQMYSHIHVEQIINITTNVYEIKVCLIFVQIPRYGDISVIYLKEQ